MHAVCIRAHLYHSSRPWLGRLLFALVLLRTGDHSRLLENTPGSVVDVFEPIWAELRAAVPPRDDHQHVLRVDDGEEVGHPAAGLALAVVIAVGDEGATS